MSIPNAESPSLSESTTPPNGSLGPTPLHWAGIKPVHELDKKNVLAQIQSRLRNIPFPWKTVELTPQPVETMVMDVLQQQLDDAPHAGWYRTACMKCLRALSKARNIVPSSLFLRDVTREGGNPVAGGGFADIWKGRLHDTQVCLKVLRTFVPEKDRADLLRDFCQEALVWRQLRHPNVLPFLGVSKDLFAPSYCLISPWIVNGDIMSYLETHPDHDRLTSLVQVAEGMKYLHNHNPPIVHADIRGANILVMEDLRCCLADFGLSLFAESQVLESSSRIRRGSIRWLAPEYIDPSLFNLTYITGRDIYAYGCTVIEIFTGKPPFSDMKNDAAVIHAVMKGSHPLQPHHLLQNGLWSLVNACLTYSPSRRPTAEQISKVFAESNLFADSFSLSDVICAHGRVMDVIDIPAHSNTFGSVHKSSRALGISDGPPVDDRTDGNSQVCADDARFSATATTTTFSGALGVAGATICQHSRTASDGGSNAHSSEGRGHGFGSTERTVVEEKKYDLLSEGLPLQHVRAPSVRRSTRDKPLPSADGEVEHYGPVQNRPFPQSHTGRFENPPKSSIGEEQPPPPSSPRTISQTGNTYVSKTSSPPSHSDSGTGSMADLSSSANEASTPKLPISPPSTPAYQTECTFAPTICALSSYGSANVASTVKPIYQIGCNVAPNINANAAMANPVYQIGCNFTPNISVPSSHSSANAESSANSFFYPPPTPPAYQIGCRFAPTIFASSSYNSANVESMVNPSSPSMPPIITSTISN
ncbi:kinase-like domain-containing protein [Armillaria nabsnona]|nr:kinase-like domain-containing protein [Armillaria nabsnona]